MALSQIETQQVLTPGAKAEVSARPCVGPRQVGTERLNAARGIILGLGIGLACWSVIGAVAWFWVG